MVVIARQSFVFANAGHNRESIGVVAEKNVRDLFHQRGTIALFAMSRIQNNQTPAVRQRTRTRAAGPFRGSVTQQVLARLGR